MISSFMLSKLYPHRFELFLFSQVAILFGSLIFPSVLFENVLSKILFLINLMAGIVLISKRKHLRWLAILLLGIAGIAFASPLVLEVTLVPSRFLELATLFLFYAMVSLETIRQVWHVDSVNKNVIMGLISGYVSLGLIGFFICISIEIAAPNSFDGIFTGETHADVLTERLMYYSYVTLLTIGYGDIQPVTPLAQKAAILIGLIGQLYLVIITATIVGRYITQFPNEEKGA